LFQDGGVLTDKLGRTANIIVTDVPAANGIIHVIDAVVLPKAP
jgi:transforming growth factor-beta-induced protein